MLNKKMLLSLAIGGGMLFSSLGTVASADSVATTNTVAKDLPTEVIALAPGESDPFDKDAGIVAPNPLMRKAKVKVVKSFVFDQNKITGGKSNYRNYKYIYSRRF